MKQILAIGGGSFASANSNLQFEQFLLSRVSKGTKTKICFLPQASAEENHYIVKFFETFTALGAEPSWISLFGRVTADWREKLLDQDIIYVGGGNTKSMLALWKEWGIDKTLKEAYEKGIILSGVSAGGICWFEEGITDSVWPLGTIKALGFLPGSFCPHFDSEPERQNFYQEQVKIKNISAGLALEDHTAAYFIDGKLVELLKADPNKKAYYLSSEGKKEIF